MQVAFLQGAVPNEPQQHRLVAPVPETTENSGEVGISGLGIGEAAESSMAGRLFLLKGG